VVGDKYGDRGPLGDDGGPFLADTDRAWMRDTIAAAKALMPEHHAYVTWTNQARGVDHFTVRCVKCGQIGGGTAKRALMAQAKAHEEGQK